MLQEQDSRILRILKQRVQAVTPIERMIVFGSRARGEAVKESDLDVFIELPILTPSLRQQIFEITWEISLENGVVISLFLTSKEMLVNSPMAGNPILHVIQSEGIAV